MSLINLWNTIPTDFTRGYLFNWDWNSTTWSNNSTVTNWTWVKTERMYQSQCLSWWASTSCTYASVTYINSYIWIYASWVWTFTKNSSKVTATTLNWVNWERYAWLTFFNRTLTDEEEQLLKLEWQRLLWPTNIAKYPKLFEWLVWYFENPTWTNELWNIANWVNSTRTGWTNTTDNLWNNKALTNPNYTWSSITYTTWYTFENSWSWWNIVTTPSWLSATWINRTTILRNIFLFTRTLSVDEVTLLQNLCNSDYPYPTPSYDLPNLRDWLVLDLNEQWQDLSWNGNNWTLVNSPTVIRQWKAKWLSYNGSNQYLENIYSLRWLTWWTLYTIINTNDISNYRNIYTLYYNCSAGQEVWALRLDNTWKINLTDNVATNTFSNLTLSIWKTYAIVLQRINSNTFNLYINWVLDKTFTQTINWNSISLTTEWTSARMWKWWSFWQYWNWIIFNPKIYNRVLSSKEIEQLYYSQKGSFIY